VLHRILALMQHGQDSKKEVFFTQGGRLYVNLSHAVQAWGRDATQDFLKNYLPPYNEALDLFDPQPDVAPIQKNASSKKILWKSLLQHRRVRVGYRKALGEWRKALKTDLLIKDCLQSFFDQQIHELKEIQERYILPYVQSLLHHRILLKHWLGELYQPEKETHYSTVTPPLHLAVYYLARVLGREEQLERDEFFLRFSQRNVSDSFTQAWDEFVRYHGHRGAGEWDVAKPSFAVDASELLPEIYKLSRVAAEKEWPNPQSQFDAGKRKLQQSNQEWIKKLGRSHWLRKWVARQTFEMEEVWAEMQMELLDAYLGLVHRVRLWANELGEEWSHQNRIDGAKDVYQLSWDDFIQASLQKNYDIRANLEKAESSKYYPLLFDTQGKIYDRTPSTRSAWQGVGYGTAVVKGHIHKLGEGTIPEDAILLARCVDGLTHGASLNARMVLLEVAGMHPLGALPPTQCGVPVVAGLRGMVDDLKEGDWVEVDAQSGKVRVIERRGGGVR